MADIDMQRKSGGAGWLAWVVGLLLLVLLVWWIWPDAENDEFAVVDTVEETTPAAELQQPATAPDGMASLPIAAILAAPDTYIGQTVSGTATVASVPTDRGFWIQVEDGQRLFVVLYEMGDEVPVDVNQGQTVRMENAMVRGADDIADVTGDVDADTRAELDGQQVFLTIDDAGITINPGTSTGDVSGAGTPATTGS